MDDVDMASGYTDDMVAAALRARRQPQLQRCGICHDLFEVDQIQLIGKTTACRGCANEMGLNGHPYGK